MIDRYRSIPTNLVLIPVVIQTLDQFDLRVSLIHDVTTPKLQRLLGEMYDVVNAVVSREINERVMEI